jgi:hypothetical protein
LAKARWIEHTVRQLNVAPIAAERLFWAHTGPDAEDHQRSERTELPRQAVDLLPRVERVELLAGVQRVGDVRRDVAIDPLPAHRRAENLTQRSVRAVAHRHRKAGPTASDRERVQLADRHIAERLDGLRQMLAHPAMTRRRALVLLQEDVDELAKRDLRAVQRPEARLAQLVVEDLLGLGLRPGSRRVGGARRGRRGNRR